MKKDFQIIREQVPIEQAAIYLLGEPVRKMFRFPGERTPSIKIYPRTNSFFDYGRGAGGDVVRLWAHVREIGNWQALQEIREQYGLTEAGTIDRQELAARIKKERYERDRRKAEESERRRQWRTAVDRIKTEIVAIDGILETEQPLTELWCFCINQRQLLEHRLDYLCGILD